MKSPFSPKFIPFPKLERIPNTWTSLLLCRYISQPTQYDFFVATDKIFLSIYPSVAVPSSNLVEPWHFRDTLLQKIEYTNTPEFFIPSYTPGTDHKNSVASLAWLHIVLPPRICKWNQQQLLHFILWVQSTVPHIPCSEITVTHFSPVLFCSKTISIICTWSSHKSYILKYQWELTKWIYGYLTNWKLWLAGPKPSTKPSPLTENWSSYSSSSLGETPTSTQSQKEEKICTVHFYQFLGRLKQCFSVSLSL